MMNETSRTCRRGFALPVVMALLVIASLFITVAFQRQSQQSMMVQRQLVEYRRHHEMFGVRAITTLWLEDNFSQLHELATRPDEVDFAYGFVLPTGAVIRIFVRDGQGTVPIDASGLDEAGAEMLAQILDRLPPERPDLVRRVGPHQISVNAAPREALMAMVEEEDANSFAERVLSARRGGDIDRAEFERILRLRGGVDDAERNALINLVTFTPGLWRLDIHVTDDQGERVFHMLTERPRQRSIAIHEWYEGRPPTDDDVLTEQGRRAGQRRTDGRR
ncbi:MAG: hypothetical protein EA376_03535 [Phycisphaeraceae bacterium]|nr:MAG: hypothetical protein EA376_03535 [Phycisphaeraceae bacterium]